jgi:hypothetical protein
MIYIIVSFAVVYIISVLVCRHGALYKTTKPLNRKTVIKILFPVFNTLSLLYIILSEIISYLIKRFVFSKFVRWFIGVK